jgi:hypothetical protein
MACFGNAGSGGRINSAGNMGVAEATAWPLTSDGRAAGTGIFGAAIAAGRGRGSGTGFFGLPAALASTAKSSNAATLADTRDTKFEPTIRMRFPLRDNSASPDRCCQPENVDEPLIDAPAAA